MNKIESKEYFHHIYPTARSTTELPRAPDQAAGLSLRTAR